MTDFIGNWPTTNPLPTGVVKLGTGSIYLQNAKVVPTNAGYPTFYLNGTTDDTLALLAVNKGLPFNYLGQAYSIYSAILFYNTKMCLNIVQHPDIFNSSAVEVALEKYTIVQPAKITTTSTVSYI